MSISLKKNERISLKKLDGGLQKLRFGISWETDAPNFDVDIQAFICENRTVGGVIKPQVIDDTYTVFYNNKVSADGSFQSSSGDDLGTDGKGAETIDGDLTKIDSRAVEVALISTINKADTRHQSFGMCKGGKIFIQNSETGDELASWQFGPGAFSTETALHIGSVVHGDDGWEFLTVGQGGVKDFETIAVEDYGYPT